MSALRVLNSSCVGNLPVSSMWSLTILSLVACSVVSAPLFDSSILRNNSSISSKSSNKGTLSPRSVSGNSCLMNFFFIFANCFWDMSLRSLNLAFVFPPSSMSFHLGSSMSPHSLSFASSLNFLSLTLSAGDVSTFLIRLSILFVTLLTSRVFTPSVRSLKSFFTAASSFFEGRVS